MASLFKNPKKWLKSAKKKIKQTVKGAGKIASKTIIPGALLAKTVGKVVPGVKDTYGAMEDAIQGKSAKKAAKKFIKGVKASAPIAASLAGASAVGAAVGAAGGGLDKLTGGLLGKAGNLAGNLAGKLEDVQNALGELGGSDNAQPSMSSSTQQPFAADANAGGVAELEPPQRAGMDPKTMLLIGGAVLGVILLTRKR